MRTSTGILATALLWAALLVTGCTDDGAPRPGPALLLHPAGAQGPDPFTDSTATTPATPPTLARTPRSAPAPHGMGAPATLTGLRVLSGGTPGLYGGSERTLSCDVERQTDLLTTDPARAGAFAQAMGVAPEELSAYLHSLTPVVLRADTRVTDHGYRAGRAVDRQAVLQTGTAVLADERGLPRVRCACGNPLSPPRALPGGTATDGRPWPGYRPTEVVVVARAPRVMSGITLLDVADNTWIERRIGHAVQHDRPLPPPDRPPRPQAPVRESPEPTPTPGDREPWPTEPPEPPGPPGPPTRLSVDAPASGLPPTDETGPDSVPDTPDLPDGGGLIPDATDAPDGPDSPEGPETPDGPDTPDPPDARTSEDTETDDPLPVE
ncbi:DUF6777 domain-containing protein [Streptomyces sp. NPDC057877]|uniref:DUF6777 domain-containing protein n=1 Tax=Streptomyces sp. NPDC057877 TaxID=3346269 RepID=UPI0036AC2FCA